MYFAEKKSRKNQYNFFAEIFPHVEYREPLGFVVLKVIQVNAKTSGLTDKLVINRSGCQVSVDNLPRLKGHATTSAKLRHQTNQPFILQ